MRRAALSALACEATARYRARCARLAGTAHEARNGREATGLYRRDEVTE
jgi:hypothetical protein